MSKEERWSVLNFVKERGAVYESELWREFVKDDTLIERGRVLSIIQDLNYKGLVEHGVNEHGLYVVRYARNSYQ